MPVARSAKSWLAPTAKTFAPRVFWRAKYGMLRRLGESRPDVQPVASAHGVYVNNFVFVPKAVPAQPAE
jgi:hypothetical protein